MIQLKKEVNIFDYAAQINAAMKKGILLTTKAGDQVNTMTIGWGTMGIEWGRPIFTAFVRESRYTRELLDQSQEFTISIPTSAIDPQVLVYCGRHSGRDVNKILEQKLTLVEPDVVAAPGIKELPLTIECKVLYRQLQDLEGVPQEILDRYYPAFTADGQPDRHYAYYGEIQKAYLIED